MGSTQRAVVKLYRFFNMTADKNGEPFALCDDCKPKQRVPDSCILRLIAIGAVDGCVICHRHGENIPSES